MRENYSWQTGGNNGAPNACQRILVVDDEPFIRMLNAKVLMRFGYQVDTAEDGAAAWQALNAKSYDLLITDHTMPKLSGVELLKKVRAAGMFLPVVMATGGIPNNEANQVSTLQPIATLLKPYTVDDLLGMVNRFLGEPDIQAEHFDQKNFAVA